MRHVRMMLACLVAALGLGVAASAAPALAYPPGGEIGTAEINATVFDPGDTVVVTAFTTTPGPLTMQLFSAPVTIGTGTVGPDFTGTVSGRIPAGYSGAHTILVTAAGGERYPFAITVRGTGGGATPPGTPEGGGGGGLATTGQDVAVFAGAGVLALLVGGLVLVAARRRRVRPGV